MPQISSRATGGDNVTMIAANQPVGFNQLSNLLQKANASSTYENYHMTRRSSYQSNYSTISDLCSSPSVLEDVQDVTRDKPGRKGKRRYMSTLDSGPNDSYSATSDQVRGAAGPFYCTFCPTGFKTHSDWKRHEASIHALAKKWICMPENIAITNNTCAFCRLDSPSQAHLEEHNIRVCLEKDIVERTFTRKDHLKQHIEQVHLSKRRTKTKYSGKMSDCWARDAHEAEFAPGTLWCGFCRANFVSWKERVKHVSSHFQNGAKMADWSYKPS